MINIFAAVLCFYSLLRLQVQAGTPNDDYNLSSRRNFNYNNPAEWTAPDQGDPTISSAAETVCLHPSHNHQIEEIYKSDLRIRDDWRTVLLKIFEYILFGLGMITLPIILLKKILFPLKLLAALKMFAFIKGLLFGTIFYKHFLGTASNWLDDNNNGTTNNF